MITILSGKKGSGKTKKLIDLAHKAVAESKGNVVCVEKGDTLTYDVDHKARLVNIGSYGIVGFEGLYGFIAGLLCGFIPSKKSLRWGAPVAASDIFWVIAYYAIFAIGWAFAHQ